jgi:hypothetical protein
MYTPLHHHPNDGGFHIDCQRCQLEHAAPEMFALLETLQRTLAWGTLKGVSKASLVERLSNDNVLVSAFLNRVAPVVAGQRRIRASDQT